MALREKLNQVTKKTGNSVYSGLGDILTKDVNPKYVLSAAVLAGSLALTNCATTKVYNTQSDYSERVKDANLERYKKDASDRLGKFDPVIQRDAGKIEWIYEIVDNKGVYNAYYTWDERVLFGFIPITTNHSITIRCLSDYSLCATGGVEHEVGHFIFHNLDKEQRQEVMKAIDDDSKHYREDVRKIFGSAYFLEKIGVVAPEYVEDTELFAYTIDFLYKGPNEGNDIYTYEKELAKPVLEELANVQYKGHKIFENEVKNHRAKALVKK
jgi:hypothetical protein